MKKAKKKKVADIVQYLISDHYCVDGRFLATSRSALCTFITSRARRDGQPSRRCQVF